MARKAARKAGAGKKPGAAKAAGRVRVAPETKKIILGEPRIPKAWYNIAADLPVALPPVLHPGTLKPVGPDDQTGPQPRPVGERDQRLALPRQEAAKAGPEAKPDALHPGEALGQHAPGQPVGQVPPERGLPEIVGPEFPRRTRHGGRAVTVDDAERLQGGRVRMKRPP